MDISITLVIDKVLPLQSGVSSKGNTWTKQEFIGKTLEQFPKTVVFNLFGDAINQNPIMEGHTYNVHLDIESRSYVDKNGNERWSTNVSAWKVEMVSGESVPQTEQQQQGFFPNQNIQPEQQQSVVPDNDLPF